MRAFVARKLSLRVYLALPVALLLLTLLATIAVAQFRLRGVVGARSEPILAKATVEKPGTSFLEATKRLGAFEQEEAKKTKVAMGFLTQVQTLLDLIGSPTGGSSQGAAVSQMRRAVAKVVTLLFSPGAEEDNGPSLDGEVKAFGSALMTYRQKLTLPRERTCAADLERNFASLINAGEDLRNLRNDKADWISGLASAEAPEAANGAISRETQIGRPEESVRGSELAEIRSDVTLLSLASAACVVGTVFLGKRRIGGAVTHLAEVARDVTRGGQRKASLNAAGDLRELAEAFNGMIEARHRAEESLIAAQSSLELKVSARTAELWRANKALREESEQRARVEGEFYQAQKMDALGKLAGSIAHDFNNLLTVIIGGAECVQKQVGADHAAMPLLRTIQQAGERAAGLTQPLLTFSRNQVLAIDILDLNVAAEEAGRMLQRLLGVNIEMKLNLATDLKAIKANANQIQQVLVNLGVNARDAMDVNGTLTISTMNCTRTNPAAKPGQDKPSEWVVLMVKDTGCGMDAATKERMFEPFFTTKPVGKGTGLGLATVFGIVKQLDGFLEVESAPGEGTTFHVFIPATNEMRTSAPAPHAAAPVPAVKSSSEKETVLLVDDEEHIRMLASMTLEERGYLVLAASHAEEAIMLAEKHRGTIKALITDVVMPGINGVQLAEMLCKVVPGIRVLFVSGHSKEVVSTSKLLSAHNNYLQKPYRGDALISKVHEILSGQEARIQLAEPENVAALWMN